jgi:hypothetical protein
LLNSSLNGEKTELRSLQLLRGLFRRKVQIQKRAIKARFKWRSPKTQQKFPAILSADLAYSQFIFKLFEAFKQEHGSSQKM